MSVQRTTCPASVLWCRLVCMLLQWGRSPVGTPPLGTLCYSKWWAQMWPAGLVPLAVGPSPSLESSPCCWEPVLLSCGWRWWWHGTVVYVISLLISQILFFCLDTLSRSFRPSPKLLFVPLWQVLALCFGSISLELLVKENSLKPNVTAGVTAGPADAVFWASEALPYQANQSCPWFFFLM